jgi:hypothetical protein
MALIRIGVVRIKAPSSIVIALQVGMSVAMVITHPVTAPVTRSWIYKKLRAVALGKEVYLN